MIGSWYLLIPVLLPILSGLALCFFKSFEDAKKRNLFTLVIMVVNVLALLPVLFSGHGDGLCVGCGRRLLL